METPDSDQRSVWSSGVIRGWIYRPGLPWKKWQPKSQIWTKSPRGRVIRKAKRSLKTESWEHSEEHSLRGECNTRKNSQEGVVHIAKRCQVKENEGYASPLDLVIGKSRVVLKKTKLTEWMGWGELSKWKMLTWRKQCRSLAGTKGGEVRVRMARLGEIGLKARGLVEQRVRCAVSAICTSHSVVRDQVGNLAHRGICATLNTWVSIFAP